ncbi:hypothetical protein QBC47DRAFT_378392 [Echria macrotheca]|uniref:Uncharacterized protein n=1 Tax=Echria macrotheca TaxID=438768 RepID=A0AAJ0BFS3_9PEZI|nr:hypothetical protein QBC47DRAFT_378392 [Echria macrotheca]
MAKAKVKAKARKAPPSYGPARRQTGTLPPATTPAALAPCCLGIDIGSHRSRICIWADGSEIVVENQYSHDLDSTHYPGDFPSALYVFDDASPGADKVYLEEGEYETRQSISAKYVFYALTESSDALLEQYPPAHHILLKKRDPVFRAKLRAGLTMLLSVLRRRAMDVCRIRKLQVSKIGLTIPVQWTLEFEEVYRGLVAEVFEIPSDIIYFFTETEALARYLFKYNETQMDPDGKHQAVLFFDFGGHNLNGCAFGVARDEQNPERNGFYRVGKKFGAGGGSEQWEHHVNEWFMNAWYGITNTVAPPQYREDFLGRFRKQKGRKTELLQDIGVMYPLPDGSPCRVTLTTEVITSAWVKALGRPLETARREIARFVSMVESGCVTSPLVVVSGGTARNPAVKSRMTTLCEQSGIPVVFTSDFADSIAYDSAKVAKAASYVVSETLTLEQFFARGAAIGIQMKQAPSQGKHKTAPLQWDNSAALLLGLRRRPKVTLAVRYCDEFKLICDPFFERLPRKQQVRVSSKLSYDLIYLGKRKQGTWTFQLSLEGSGDTMDLVLHQLYQRRRDLEPKPKKTLRLPLYFDGNSSTIHVGDRNKAIDELKLGLPPQPNDLGEVETDPSEESDHDDDSDVDSIVVYAPQPASQGTDTGIAPTSLSKIEDDMFTSAMFTVPDVWTFPGGEQTPPTNAEGYVQQVEISPMFDGLPAPRKMKRGGGKASNRRADPYGQAWKRRHQDLLKQ